MKDFSQKAFTLAEVLITLAIIGVVAAMTIPTLISNISNKQHLTAYKKKYAELVEAIKLSSIDNQEPSKWDYSLDDDEFFAAYLAPYLKVSKCNDCWISYKPKGFWFESPAYAAAPPVELEYCLGKFATLEDSLNNQEYEEDSGCYDVISQQCINSYNKSDACKAWMDAQSTTPPDAPEITYSLVNGSTLGLVKKDKFFYLYLDVNGTGSPNKYGLDKFVFNVIDNRVLPYGYGTQDLTSGKYGCSNSGNGMYCGAMIMQNNWNYPDNYPKL